MIRVMLACGVGGLCLALLLSGPGLSGQEKDTPKVTGKLPKYWSKLGLSDQQRQRIFAVQQEFRPKIDQLKSQLKKAVEDEKRGMLAVLTKEQRTRLRELVAGPEPSPSLKDKGIEKKE
jgi:hypothetical protein